jgi:hypothetical protein
MGYIFFSIISKTSYLLYIFAEAAGFYPHLGKSVLEEAA